MLTRYHIRPTHGWLNDPNGVTYGDGRWHVFFQHNPAAPVHDRIHWGHVSSSDLVTWTEHPVAFGPQAGGPDEFGCWSGVFAPGLERPAVVYSGVRDAGGQSTVCLRWGSDDLLTWSDPIVVARTPYEAGVEIMRDPFLFQWQERSWALLGAGLVDGRAAVLVFSCDDPLAWRYEGRLATSDEPILREVPRAEIWECPQVAIVDGQLVLVLSCWFQGVLGDVVWVAGRFEPTASIPRFVGTGWGRVDDGASFYAPQLVATPDGPLLFGWVRSREPHDPDIPVASSLTLPRRLTWDPTRQGGQLASSLDPGVARALRDRGEQEQLASGRHTVAEQCVVTVPRATVASLGDPAMRFEVADATLWFDADVVEIYRAEGPPLTVRGLGAWLLDIPAGVSGVRGPVI